MLERFAFKNMSVRVFVLDRSLGTTPKVFATSYIREVAIRVPCPRLVVF
jgi:hypothetical protein